MRLFFSTVVRHGEANSGEFVCVDWGTKEVINRVPVEEPGGGRGLWVDGESIYAASPRALYCYDLQLEKKEVVEFKDPIHDIHEILMVEPGRLWFAATGSSSAVELDLSTGEHLNELRLDSFNQHLNAVAMWRGVIHALINGPGVVVNMKTGMELLRHPALRQAHSLVFEGDRAFVCATAAKEVIEFDLLSGEVVRSLSLRSLPWVYRLEREVGEGPPYADPIFARGLRVRDGEVFVGISPASVVSIDWESADTTGVYQHSERVDTVVHGLALGSVDV